MAFVCFVLVSFFKSPKMNIMYRKFWEDLSKEYRKEAGQQIKTGKGKKIRSKEKEEIGEYVED